MYAYAGNNPVKYTDPDGNAAWSASMWWLTFADGALPVGDIIYGIGVTVELIGLAYVANKYSTQTSDVALSKAAENTKNNDEITMYHYSQTPPEKFGDFVWPNAYVSPDLYETGGEADNKLALPNNKDGSPKTPKYRYTIKVKPEEIRPAENSIPGTNIVDKLGGKEGGGTEFKTNVPKEVLKVEAIPE